MDQYQIYRTPTDSLKHYYASKPISWVRYAQAPGFEQWIDGFFTRNFGKRLNVGLSYEKIGAQGLYQFQKADSRTFRVFAQWSNKAANHRVFVDFELHRNSNNENGGLDNDTLFNTPPRQPRKAELIRNNSAQSKFRTNSITIQQIRLLTNAYKKNSIAAYHNLQWANHKFVYKDLDTPLWKKNYYPSTPLFIDSTTQDSILFHTINNEFGLCLPNWKSNFRAKAGIYHQFGQYIGYDFSQSLNQLGAKFFIDTKIANRIVLQGHANLVFAGTNAGTFSIEPKTQLLINKNLILEANLISRRQAAALISQNYSSNHFFIRNNFAPLLLNQLGFGLHSKWASLSTATTILQNIVAFDSLGMPFQTEQAFAIQQFRLQFNINWWKLKFLGDANYQLFASTAPIRLPKLHLVGSLILWHQFKSGWEAQVGADLAYMNAFAPYGFQPINNQFVLQSQILGGNFPWVDVFAAIKVKRFRFFSKTENLAQGFMGNGLYTVHRYPQTDRIFKIGLSWLFIN